MFNRTRQTAIDGRGRLEWLLIGGWGMGVERPRHGAGVCGGSGGRRK